MIACGMHSAKAAYHPLSGSGMIWARNGIETELHHPYNHFSEQYAKVTGHDNLANGLHQAKLVTETA